MEPKPAKEPQIQTNEAEGAHWKHPFMDTGALAVDTSADLLRRAGHTLLVPQALAKETSSIQFELFGSKYASCTAHTEASS